MYFFCSFPSSHVILRKVVWFQWLIIDDVMSYDEAENRPESALK